MPTPALGGHGAARECIFVEIVQRLPNGRFARPLPIPRSTSSAVSAWSHGFAGQTGCDPAFCISTVVEIAESDQALTVAGPGVATRLYA